MTHRRRALASLALVALAATPALAWQSAPLKDAAASTIYEPPAYYLVGVHDHKNDPRSVVWIAAEMTELDGRAVRWHYTYSEQPSTHEPYRGAVTSTSIDGFDCDTDDGEYGSAPILWSYYGAEGRLIHGDRLIGDSIRIKPYVKGTLGEKSWNIACGKVTPKGEPVARADVNAASRKILGYD